MSATPPPTHSQTSPTDGGPSRIGPSHSERTDSDDGFAARAALIDDPSVRGAELCGRLSDATDEWLAALCADAVREHRDAPDFALVAVGGYGRRELAPFSDIDVVLVHRGKPAKIEALASSIWYPIWDRGVKLGHAVRRLDEHIDLVKFDLDTASASLSARLVYGDADMAKAVVDAGQQQWVKRSAKWQSELRERVDERERTAGDVAYVLEPDLKDGHGGLRDAHSVVWGALGGLPLTDEDRTRLRESYLVLLDARVALHRAAGRPNESLRLDLQDSVAALLGQTADELMAHVSAAGRHIAWLSEQTWAVRGQTPDSEVAPNVWLKNGEIELTEEVDVTRDPTVMLRIATAAARRRVRIGRATLDRLEREVQPWPSRWPVGAVDKLVALLLEGHAAIPVIESLDQASLVGRILPEWEPNRSRPQRNAYHRFTVDRHLWETAANAADLVGMVSRADLLVLGALFHDIGKGYPGDHTEVGMKMVAEIGPRIGLNERDTEVLVKMVEHHLLLPDVASRRDISDPATIEAVAEAVGSTEVLELLHALTIADSKATGPSAWSQWKEDLVADLVDRVSFVVRGGDVGDVSWTLFPDEQTVAAMASGVASATLHGTDRVVVVYVDLPGALYRVAGALSLHGLDVVTARSHSDEPQLGQVAMAAAEFRVEPPAGGIDRERVLPDLERSLVGQLAIDARIDERARAYRHSRRTMQAASPLEPSVRFLDEASSDATVVEVRAPTRIGILYAITKALANTGCDIRHANVQTVGADAYDTFYVRDWNDNLVVNPDHRNEIIKAVLFAVRQ